MVEQGQPKQVPIAIVGVSALFPGSNTVEGFWRDILAGRDLITDVPPTHWLIDDYYDPDPSTPDKTYGRRGAFLPPVDFDPLAFGVPPTNIPSTDTAQLLAMVVAQQVLEDATQGQFNAMNRDRVSVVLGVCGAQELMTALVGRLQRPVWIKALRESGIEESEAQEICDRIAAHYVPWQEASFPGLLGNVVAGRIANRFDLHGTNCVTDAACASSLSAMSMSINELALGQSDLVITGGVDTMNDPFTFMCFSKTPALSPTGDCRPFSDISDGTMLGEGLAMFALKRLADAQRDGDRIYAVIRGVGASSDGQGTAIYAPASKGQARALLRAYDAAGYGPETIELMEAHGTGTKAGDAAEFEGLRAVFDASGRADRQWCALGSVKSQIGHTKAAAGAAGLFKIVMALHHKVLPPTLKVERPNPKLDIETSAFYLNTQARPWIRDASHPRRAAVSSFGFGGSNFHATLEEYVPSADDHARMAWRLRAAPSELVLLAGASAGAVVEQCRTLMAQRPMLERLARESQLAFAPNHAARLALVATDSDDLARKLEQAAAMLEKGGDEAFATPTGIHYATGAAQPSPIALLFSGQGSQYVGMGADVAMHVSEARAAWDAAAALRFDDDGLHRVVFPIPAFSDAERVTQAERLTATEWAQPALAVQSLALLNVLRALGVRADCLGGHSFGELVALHAAGVYDADTLIRLARRRGELMRDAASTPGAMLAIPRTRSDVRALLTRLGATEVCIANHNAPLQVVVSGRTEAIARLEQALAAEGVNAKRLNVATAFHSELVAPASGPLLKFLEDAQVQSPQIDVYGNSDAAVYAADPHEVRRRVASQLVSPVRFVDEIEAMYANGARTFIEVGAGSALADLVGQILGEREHLAVSLDRKGKNGMTSLHEALGRMALRGMAIDFTALWAPYAPPRELPVKKKAAMTLKITGANYGRPYPPPGGVDDLPVPNPLLTKAPSANAAPISADALPMSVSKPGAYELPAPAVMPLQPVFASETATSAPDDLQFAWLRAFEAALHQTADAHTAYQRAMSDSHVAFLKLAETSTSGLVALFGEQTPAPIGSVTQVPHAALVTSTPTESTSSRMSARAPASKAMPAERAATAPAAPVAPAVTPSAQEATNNSAAVDLQALLLDVVAEKTGYPVDMLDAHMELEADLGIDSIKRVEILSAMRERAPHLQELKPAELGKLRTLGQIAEQLGGNVVAPARTAPGPTPVAPAAAVTPIAPSPHTDIDLQALLLQVVAEKTGYPTEMLEPHMELEADLGIDSIKRVEILSAMRARAPDLQELKPADLGKLRTLGQIVEQLRGPAIPSSTPAPARNAEGAVAPQPPATQTKLLRFAVRAIPTPSPGLGIARIYDGPVVVTEDGTGVAQQLAAKLAEHGVQARVVDDVPSDASRVIFLGGLRAVASVDEAVAINREAFRAARTLAARLDGDGGVFVTVQDTGGDFGLSAREPLRAWLGGIAGLARTRRPGNGRMRR